MFKINYKLRQAQIDAALLQQQYWQLNFLDFTKLALLVKFFSLRVVQVTQTYESCQSCAIHTSDRDFLRQGKGLWDRMWTNNERQDNKQSAEVIDMLWLVVL
eukprot:TRINITY_DN4988_c0_g1_i3.p5 TRINITY_DN4988_c0_g1~~TRINITY_DN4988_c0_g1_i3.p5  ORF type:complete len:102 (+),score=2.42 TRINITY_DN4988_c0_g1_i3:732-1037(+)